MPKGTGANTAAGTGGNRYRPFPLEGAHVRRGEKFFKDGEASSDERFSTQRYTGSAYYEVNRFLRGQTSQAEGEAQPIIDRLDDMFNKPGARTKANGVVYRGLGSDDPIRNALIEGKLKVGTVFSDKAFVSTSISAKQASDFGTSSNATGGLKPVLRIRVKKGSKAVHVRSVSNFKNEFETLLARGAKFKIRGAKTQAIDGKGMYVIDADLIQ